MPVAAKITPNVVVAGVETTFTIADVFGAPLVQNGPYYGSVLWGDSTPGWQAIASPDGIITHTYTTAGTYSASVIAQFLGSESLFFGDIEIQVEDALKPTFDVSTDIGYARLSVAVSDTTPSDPAYTRRWLVDGVQVGTDNDFANRTIDFYSEGVFSLQLEATYQDGPVLSDPVTITVYPTPVLALGVEPTVGNVPVTLNFTDLTTPATGPAAPVAWNWTIPWGRDSADITSTAQNPTVDFTEFPGSVSGNATCLITFPYPLPTELQANIFTPNVGYAVSPVFSVRGTSNPDWNQPWSFNGSDVVSLPARRIDDEEYAAIRIRAVRTIPQAYFDNGGYPLRDIYLWPQPDKVYGIELWLWEPLRVYDLDAKLDLPPGYERYLRFKLAIELAAEFGKEVSPDVVAAAMEAERNLKSLNQQVPVSRLSFSTKPKWNWLTVHAGLDTLPKVPK